MLNGSGVQLSCHAIPFDFILIQNLWINMKSKHIAEILSVRLIREEINLNSGKQNCCHLANLSFTHLHVLRTQKARHFHINTSDTLVSPAAPPVSRPMPVASGSRVWLLLSLPPPASCSLLGPGRSRGRPVPAPPTPEQLLRPRKARGY